MNPKYTTTIMSNTDHQHHTNTNTNTTSSSTTSTTTTPLRKFIHTHSLSPLVAGLSGGLVSTSVLYPLDLIKVRMQVNEEPLYLVRQQQHKKSILSSLRFVVRNEGARGLYQGLGPALLASGVSWGGYFYLYEYTKGRLRARRQRHSDNNNNVTTQQQQNSSLDHFVAACSSGAALVALTNPFWLLKTRLQLQIRTTPKEAAAAVVGTTATTPYTGALHAIRVIVRDEGILALYKGAVPALLLASHGGVQFVVYEQLKQWTGNEYSQRPVSSSTKTSVLTQLRASLGYLTMGAVSKIIASTTTYPLQVIKSRLQQRSRPTTSASTTNTVHQYRHYRGVCDCARRIWRYEGALGFFKGCLPNAIRVAPSSAITFVVYESVMDFLRE